MEKPHSITAIACYYVNSQSVDVGKTPEATLEFAYRHYPLKPEQAWSAILRFARLVYERRPKTLVEFGAHTDGTFFDRCRCADLEAMVISLDVPGAQFSGGYP